jgi:uncharacterized protein (TIGR02265 family)
VDLLIRGYIIHYSGRFILEDPVLSKRVDPSILEEIAKNESAFLPTHWRPREEAMVLWRAIAGVYGPSDERGAHQALVRCGEKMSTYATTTWLRLLLRMLTPRMFVTKFPDTFRRDHKFGRLDVESVADKSFVVIFKEVGGYDHFAPIAQGLATYAMTTMGLGDVKMTITPWSLANPAADELRVVASWR